MLIPILFRSDPAAVFSAVFKLCHDFINLFLQRCYWFGFIDDISRERIDFFETSHSHVHIAPAWIYCYRNA